MAKVKAGKLDALYAPPAGDGRAPGVLVLHESFGLTDDIRAIATRFAEEGYAALAPDLYSGGLRPLCIARVLRDVVTGGDGTTELIAEARDWLAARREVDGERIGVIGFCLGGGFALAAAARAGFSAAGVAYGQVPGDLRELEGICPVVASYGGRDRVYGSHGDRLAGHLDELGVEHDVKTYPDSGHSFMNRHPALGLPGWSPVDSLSLATPVNPLLRVGYNPDDAEDSWRRILAFFGERLRPRRAAP
jgi:carboxymethylenebutenolidase